MQIVVVDDEPISLAVLKHLAAKLPNCNVQGFSQASAALSWCAPNEPDVVIVDYMMPEFNGIEFTRRLCSIKDRADTPLIMVTASADRRVRNRALENGINDVLSKPFDFDELYAKVSSMLVVRAHQKRRMDRAFLLAQGHVSAVDTSPQPRLLDIAMSLSRLAGDARLLGSVAGLFESTVPSLIATIGAALADRDLDLAHAETYALKGAVSALEAPEVLSAVLDLETHTREGDPDGAAIAYAKVEMLVGRLRVELSPMASPDAGSHKTV